MEVSQSITEFDRQSIKPHYERSFESSENSLGNNKLIIRLIDVAFIILFGFIGVSGLKTEYVDLPTGSDPTKTPQEFRELTLQIHKEAFVLIDDGRKSRFTKLEEVEAQLLGMRERLQRSNTQLMLTVESSKKILMQSLIDVIDMCHRNKIQKNLNYVVLE